MWCAKKSPENPDGQIILRLEFKESCKLALVRFWVGQFGEFAVERSCNIRWFQNYNASRVHAQIGVRYLEMNLDGIGIFRGELECAFSADSEFTPIMGEVN